MHTNLPADASTEKIASIFAGLPAPIIHNKRLGEILYAMLTRLHPMRGKFRKPDDLDILTCHNYADKPLLEKSLDYLGIQGYRVLQKPVAGPWRNTLKLTWMLDYLEKNGSDARYALFCDADDTVLVNDPQHVLDVFTRRQCRLLFMSTSFMGGYACMPEVKKWADRVCPGRYLNSGVYVGEKAFLIKVLKAAHEYITDNDITAEESQRLGHGVFNADLCKRLPEYPKGSQDQDILRYIHPRFYPDMQVDQANELAFRNL